MLGGLPRIELFSTASATTSILLLVLQEGADAVLKKCFFLEVILEIGYT